VGRVLHKNDLFFAHIIDSNVTKDIDLMKLLQDLIVPLLIKKVG
jgi:hypothetical protein